jgi:hypothetical protein
VNLSKQGPQDDDGPAAMRLVRRRLQNEMLAADGSPEAMARYRARKDRWRQYVTPETRRRGRERAKAARVQQHGKWRCVECGAAVSHASRDRCPSCANRRRYQAAFRARALLETSQPFQRGRNSAHERNITRLQQARLDLPL